MQGHAPTPGSRQSDFLESGHLCRGVGGVMDLWLQTNPPLPWSTNALSSSGLRRPVCYGGHHVRGHECHASSLGYGPLMLLQKFWRCSICGLEEGGHKMHHHFKRCGSSMPPSSASAPSPGQRNQSQPTGSVPHCAIRFSHYHEPHANDLISLCHSS